MRRSSGLTTPSTGLNASVLVGSLKRGREIARAACRNGQHQPRATGSLGERRCAHGRFPGLGVGRRHGKEGLLKYTEIKNVAAQRIQGFTRPDGISDKMWGQGLITVRRHHASTRYEVERLAQMQNEGHYDVVIVGSGLRSERPCGWSRRATASRYSRPGVGLPTGTSRRPPGRASSSGYRAWAHGHPAHPPAEQRSDGARRGGCGRRLAGLCQHALRAQEALLRGQALATHHRLVRRAPRHDPTRPRACWASRRTRP